MKDASRKYAEEHRDLLKRLLSEGGQSWLGETLGPEERERYRAFLNSALELAEEALQIIDADRS